MLYTREAKRRQLRAWIDNANKLWMKTRKWLDTAFAMQLAGQTTQLFTERVREAAKRAYDHMQRCKTALLSL
jgi:geranylgeranyl pyrophosphate synthase